MRGENFLLAVARIALTFVTFAGIIGLMRPNSDEWSPNYVRGLKFVFEFDLAATFFALIPFPFLYTLGDKNEVLVWRISISRS